MSTLYLRLLLAVGVVDGTLKLRSHKWIDTCVVCVGQDGGTHLTSEPEKTPNKRPYKMCFFKRL